MRASVPMQLLQGREQDLRGLWAAQLHGPDHYQWMVMADMWKSSKLNEKLMANLTSLVLSEYIVHTNSSFCSKAWLSRFMGTYWSQANFFVKDKKVQFSKGRKCYLSNSLQGHRSSWMELNSTRERELWWADVQTYQCLRLFSWWFALLILTNCPGWGQTGGAFLFWNCDLCIVWV